MTGLAPSLEPVGLHPHEHRDVVLAEVHARPFRPVETPRRLLHFAFMTDAAQSEADRAALGGFCRSQGIETPRNNVRHHRISLDDKALRWEQHSEFTTYCWSFANSDGQLFSRPACELAGCMGLIAQPGPHLVSIDLHLVRPDAAPDIDAFFAGESLCVMTADNGAATVATDFKASADGFVRILVIDHGLRPIRAGALVQRLLELETYRLLALLGLPEAQRLTPAVRSIEESLVKVTREMTQADCLDDNQRLLDNLAALAAQLEAGAAESLYRFGASRAYENIVQGRLTAIRFESICERETFTSFLDRRMGPALKTCAAIEERQINLSIKLARATQLLRTKIDIALERQNRDILITLSERARMQLRLQQTVEILSIAAVSYYVVGLMGHAMTALKKLGLAVDPEVATAATIPVVVFVMAFLVVRRLRPPPSGVPTMAD